MSTVETKRMTAEEFLEFVYRPENVDRFFELERGEAVEMPTPGKFHGFVCLAIGGILLAFAARRKKGYPVGNDAGFLIQRDPDTVRGPDLSYYEDDQTPATMERGYSKTCPKLAVDVLSPTDRIGQMMRRVREMLQRGVQLVWVVDPEARNVLVCRPGKEFYTVEEGEEITGEDVLPDLL